MAPFKARKLGKRIVILAADLEAWLKRPPPVSADYDESHEAKRGG
jgi:hypothetical protein